MDRLQKIQKYLATLIILTLSLSINIVTLSQERQLVPTTPDNVREITLIEEIGHGEFTDLAWSPAGDILAMTTKFGVWIYDPNDLSQPPYRLNENPIHAYSPIFSNDGRYLVVGIYSQHLQTEHTYSTIMGWDLTTGQETFVSESTMGRPEHFLENDSVAVMDKHSVDLISPDGIITTMYNASESEIQRLVAINSEITQAVVATNQDETALLDIQSGTLTVVYDRNLIDAIFSEDAAEAYFVSARTLYPTDQPPTGPDIAVIFQLNLNTLDVEEIFAYDIYHRGSGRLQHAYEDRIVDVVSDSSPGGAYTIIVDVETSEIIHEVENYPRSWFFSNVKASFSHDGDRLALFRPDLGLRLEIYDLTYEPDEDSQDNETSLLREAIIQSAEPPTETYLMATEANSVWMIAGQNAVNWDTATGQQQQLEVTVPFTIESMNNALHTSTVGSRSAQPSHFGIDQFGQVIEFYVSSDPLVVSYDIRGNTRNSFNGTRFSYAFHPSGLLAYSFNDALNNEVGMNDIYLYNLAADEEYAIIEDQPRIGEDAMAFHPESGLLVMTVTSAEYNLLIWDSHSEITYTLDLDVRYEATPIKHLIPTIDGEFFVFFTTSVGRLNIETGEVTLLFETDYELTEIAVSPNDDLVALVAPIDTGIEIWSLETASILHTIPMPSNLIMDTLLWAADGHVLITRGQDHVIRLWGVQP
ncbi:MAG: WD40 repeat domain-containing protein [Chloroflexota bacterium]